MNGNTDVSDARQRARRPVAEQRGPAPRRPRASRIPSVSNCRTMRARRAPSASRTASSLLRAAPRASSMFATLRHAMISTTPDSPSSSALSVPSGAVGVSDVGLFDMRGSGVHRQHLILVLGRDRPPRAAATPRRVGADTNASVSPGLRRPATPRVWLDRSPRLLPLGSRQPSSDDHAVEHAERQIHLRRHQRHRPGEPLRRDADDGEVPRVDANGPADERRDRAALSASARRWRWRPGCPRRGALPRR